MKGVNNGQVLAYMTASGRVSCLSVASSFASVRTEILHVGTINGIRCGDAVAVIPPPPPNEAVFTFAKATVVSVLVLVAVVIVLKATVVLPIITSAVATNRHLWHLLAQQVRLLLKQ